MNDDLISRQAVINLIRRCNSALVEPRIFERHHSGNLFECYITELPPVNPQEPKTGHWILGVCDECGYDWGKDAPIASVPNFCPNCGCRMVEPQESEVSNADSD